MAAWQASPAGFSIRHQHGHWEYVPERTVVEEKEQKSSKPAQRAQTPHTPALFKPNPEDITVPRNSRGTHLSLPVSAAETSVATVEPGKSGEEAVFRVNIHYQGLSTEQKAAMNTVLKGDYGLEAEEFIEGSEQTTRKGSIKSLDFADIVYAEALKKALDKAVRVSEPAEEKTKMHVRGKGT